MPKKTEKILATIDRQITLLENNKAKLIGERIGFTDERQVMNCTGGGVCVPGMVVFHYGRPYRDIFYFLDGRITFNVVHFSTEVYLQKVYNEAIIKRVGEEEFIKMVQAEYTSREMGF